MVGRGGQADVEKGCAFFHIQAHDLEQAPFSINVYNPGSEEFDGIGAFHGGRCEDARNAVPSLPCVCGDLTGRGVAGDDPQLDAFVKSGQSWQIGLEEFEGGSLDRRKIPWETHALLRGLVNDADRAEGEGDAWSPRWIGQPL